MAPFLSGPQSPSLSDVPTPMTDYFDNNASTTSPSSTGAEPIAICGMALRLPGGITTPSQFWDFLINKQDAQGPIPETRYSASKYYSKAGKPGFVRAERGYFLDESVDLGGLDTTLFAMPRNEAERIDPQQRILLELTRECLESAGEVDYRGKMIGAFVGSFGEDWSSLFAKDTQVPALYKVTGYGDFVLSNRISYEYDLRGPSMTIRTGCSAALISLHQACLAIRGGDCDAAIVGGCNLLMAPGLTADLSEQMVLSPRGSSNTFDADADGYARGEAVNVIYVKRLSDAMRDGNPIRAVIRGTFSNADGRTSGLTLPSYEGHEKLIRKTYEVAGINDVSATGFVECHGTGTPVGDPIETRAVAAVFGDKGVHIGSVKPNVGHSEGASGLTSLIKTVLALEHQTIPPNIKFNKPNPKIPFVERKLTVPVEPTPWPADRKERASVNSFGIGGANAHVVLDSARSFLDCPPPVNTAPAQPLQAETTTTTADPRLVLYSANTPDSLRRQIANNQTFIQENPTRLPEIAYTLAARRDHLPHRAFSIIHDAASVALSTAASAKTPSTLPPRLAFIFTGQGAQWPRMGAELLTSAAHPTFAKSIQGMDDALRSLPDGPAWSIRDELLKPQDESSVSQAAFSQPLCTAVQIALVDTLAEECGIRAQSVVGHSSGEMAAAYSAGKMTADEAIVAAYYRGVVSTQAKREGAMAALGLPWDDARPLLVDGVVVACENSPSNITISGDREKLREVLEAVKQRDASTFARELKVDKAYHSYHMEEVGELYESLLADHVKGDGSKVVNKTADASRPAMFSSVTGQQLSTKGSTSGAYWRSNLESPVLFRKAVANLVEHHAAVAGTGPNASPLVFLEIGPHSALAGPLRQTLSDKSLSCPYASCLVRDKPAVDSLLTAVGQLWQQNVVIDLARLTNPSGKLQVVPNLPSYPFQHDHSYLFETRLLKRWRSPRARKHEILGVRVVESTDNEPVWRNVLRLTTVPWLRDHNVKGDVIFPCAGYVSMVGEAVRQLTALTDDGDETESPFAGYSVRGVVIDTAMLLHENAGTEVLTSLTRHRLTDSLESDRWDFVISSHNGAAWTKHCTGQVCAVAQPSSSVVAHATEKCAGPQSRLPRHVEASKWYQVMREVGGNYGLAFQGLADISCSTTDNRAVATAQHTVRDDEEFYAVHPTKIDFFLQLLAVAAIQGVGHRMRTMAVPTYIEQMDVFVSDSEIAMAVDATTSNTGAITGGGSAVSCSGSGGQSKRTIMALDVRGVKVSPLHEDSGDGKADVHAGARIHWREDIDFADMQAMVHPNTDQLVYTGDLKELTALYIRDSLTILEAEGLTSPSTPHLHKFLDWMRRQPGPSSPTSDATFLLEILMATELDCLTIAVKQVFDNIIPVFRGDVEPIEVLVQDDILSGVYKSLNWSKRPELFRSLAHANPHMRILEIGAGTGGTTDIILSDISDARETRSTHRMFGSYTYTDISAGFFGAAQERFKRHVVDGAMEFRVLDISRDPAEQGFEEGSYDLVVASNVLHATPSLVQTLANVRRLLRPEGRLYLEELDSDNKAWNYVMGILSGWWLGEADGRVDEPYVSPQAWDVALKEAGFGGVVDYALDCPDGKHNNAFMIAKPAITWARAKDVTVLYDEASTSHAELLRQYLTEREYTVSLHDFDDAGNPVPVAKDMISVLDLPVPFLDDISLVRLQAFQKLMGAASAAGAGVLWLTRPTQLDGQCADPRWAQIQGAARVLRAELALDFATCEIGDLDGSDGSNSRKEYLAATERVLSKFLRRRSAGDGSGVLDPEYEYAIDTRGKVHVSRIYPFHVGAELADVEAVEARSKAESVGGVVSSRLDIEKPGRLSTLRWITQAVEDLGDDELLVEPKAVGMNFKDILTVMGIVPFESLGLEHTSIVRKLGRNVTGDFAIGDRVMVMGGFGFSTTVKVSKYQCVKIPETLSSTDAATMATVFATVIYSLLDVGRLRRGQSVLVHSACGGVGLAAIQIARMAGAGAIYCTVSSEDKIQHLVGSFGVPRSHIFNSRDASFHADLMRATSGEGVDVVLNSLSGELLHASWECVAEFGTMVEIGKRDLIGHGRLALNPFLLNRSYQCVDLAHLMNKKPELGHELLQRVVQYHEEGHIQPINPVKVFSVAEVQDCFLYMQKGQHIGKIVVDMEEEKMDEAAEGRSAMTAAEAISIKPHSYHFDPTAAYLLVGGLGGLGRAVSTWMVENGARRLVYLGRSAGATPADAAFIEELRSQDCAVTAIQGNVTSPSDVERAISSIPATTPLKGIINMSMVLRDFNFATMSHDDWTAAVAPKVKGTWNLHNATSTLAHKLDFFLLFSSASATFGQRGQANYAAANTFLDAFVRFRHGQGLAAQSVNIGIMLDHGYVAENDAIRERLLSRGIYGIHIAELLDSLSAVLAAPVTVATTDSSTSASTATQAQLVLGVRSSLSMHDPSNKVLFKTDRRMAVFWNDAAGHGSSSSSSGKSSSAQSSKIAALIASAANDDISIFSHPETIDFLARQIGAQLLALLLRPLPEDDKDALSIDVARSPQDMGLDSLVAIELRSWWKGMMQFDISVLELLATPTLLALGQKAAEGLRVRIAAELAGDDGAHGSVGGSGQEGAAVDMRGGQVAEEKRAEGDGHVVVDPRVAKMMP